MRYYYFLSDRKTVREIDFDTYREYAMQNFTWQNKKKLCVVFEGEVYFTKQHGITIPLHQLKQVLSEEVTA